MDATSIVAIFAALKAIGFDMVQILLMVIMFMILAALVAVCQVWFFYKLGKLIRKQADEIFAKVQTSRSTEVDKLVEAIKSTQLSFSTMQARFSVVENDVHDMKRDVKEIKTQLAITKPMEG